jgi:hypothetical protein
MRTRSVALPDAGKAGASMGNSCRHFAEEIIAETAPPPRASHEELVGWIVAVVMASLNNQSPITVRSMRAALARHLRSRHGVPSVSAEHGPRRAAP